MRRATAPLPPPLIITDFSGEENISTGGQMRKWLHNRGWGKWNETGLQQVCRQFKDDFLKVYEDYSGATPALKDIYLMIDSNTLGGTAESVLGKIWLQ